MSVDKCVASKNHGENIKTLSFQKTLGLSSAVLLHCQPMTDCYEFRFLVANLLPSIGFKMNFLVKWSAGRISKCINIIYNEITTSRWMSTGGKVRTQSAQKKNKHATQQQKQLNFNKPKIITHCIRNLQTTSWNWH